MGTVHSDIPLETNLNMKTIASLLALCAVVYAEAESEADPQFLSLRAPAARRPSGFVYHFTTYDNNYPASTAPLTAPVTAPLEEEAKAALAPTYYNPYLYNNGLYNGLYNGYYNGLYNGYAPYAPYAGYGGAYPYAYNGLYPYGNYGYGLNPYFAAPTTAAAAPAAPASEE